MPASTLGAPPLGPGAPTANVYTNNRNTNSTYDAAGNLTVFGSVSVAYDAENRQKTAGSNSYLYDGLGQRVGKTTTSGTTVYVNDALGQLAAEYGSASSNLCTTCYLSYDHLGSTRMVTDQNANVVARHDYAPYGQEMTAGVGGRSSLYGASDNVRQKFTGYERDSETALDFAQARYMSSGLGRFLSPDPANAGADLANPQSWNGYAYVLGNPLAMVDPSGLDSISSGGDPCDDDPFACDPGLGPFPPGGFPAPEPPPPPPPTQTEGTATGSPLPPGSFPGGETLGLPPGLSLPGPFGIGLPNPLIFSACSSDPNCLDGQWVIDYKGDLVWIAGLSNVFHGGGTISAAPRRSNLNFAGSCAWAAIQDSLLGLGSSAGGVLVTSRIPNGKVLLGLKSVGSPDTSLWSAFALWARQNLGIGFGTRTVKGVNAAGATLATNNTIRAFGPVLNAASWVITAAEVGKTVQNASTCYGISH